MRGVLLPVCGNPFLLQLWLQSFRRYWKDEVDRVYVAVTVPVEEPVMRFMLDTLEASGSRVISVAEAGQTATHGEALAGLLRESEEQFLLLIEDDCFVLRSGAVAGCFRLLESGDYDIAASARSSATTGVVDQAQRVFGIGENPFFWPNMFFTARDVLTRTDLDFAAHSWQAGEFIKPLDYVCQREECADTFGWASIQIRALQPRVFPISQHHAQATDLDDCGAGRGLFGERPPWVHFGSLSGSTHLLMDQQGMIVAYRGLRVPGHMEDVHSASAQELERRLAMWRLCWEHFPISDQRAAYYNDVFDFALSNVLAHKGEVLDKARVDGFASVYARLLAPLFDDAGA